MQKVMLCVAQFFVEINCFVVSGESPQGSVGRFDSKARQCKASFIDYPDYPL